jgi:hypothetical protein
MIARFGSRRSSLILAVACLTLCFLGDPVF